MPDPNPLEATQNFKSAPEKLPLDATRPTTDFVHDKHPERIGRYRIEKVLGKGGFGLVYLAHDEQLDRSVAIKVPHAKLLSKPEDAEAYLAEARTVANLDHPSIVPVHDIGSTEDCPCYVVSKYIPGMDLATKLKQQRFRYREAAELVATVADALHYAHKQGLVHRDIKPGNILIGKDGKPFVVDFGLALREENIGKGPKHAGTPSYMSPEQARAEGHRVDGRSDIFSLGVVLYELLAGRQPFRGDTLPEILEQVTSHDPRPLRQYDERLPKELERICSKAMSKRASERYSSAHDLAEDLRLFLVEQSILQSGSSPGGIAAGASNALMEQTATTSVGSVVSSPTNLNPGSSDSQPIKIVPKGLRSFDAHDADFFLELLPGARDRNGLPDSIRFWKTRIEETDPDKTFSVGLIYGPSGCGKSSMVKAGLLPRLSVDVIPVYVEATPAETEPRLLHGLRRGCAALDDTLSLKASLKLLRRGQGIPEGKKVLIVLDQFEQWLHANKEEDSSELVQALRQCDGGRVQCIVMVRDDFWMAATRFMRDLEVRLIEGQNSAAADLFPVRHVEKVLAAFGRAFGALPDDLSQLNKEQQDFVTKSVAGLAEDGKVICVRLALFAEMMKGKSWTPAVLNEVGGTAGVGVTFLEETFSASTAPPEHRYHQKAARAVLSALLPGTGTDIKGTMRSYGELLESSGYAKHPKDFDDLVRILDSEIRLITPTDPEGLDTDPSPIEPSQTGLKYFQLTHDYLVPSLRDWLTRKQRETRRGRAELKLAERASTWNAKRENKQLPTLAEWLSIRWLTNTARWADPQRAMMRSAGKLHGMIWGGGLGALLLIGGGIQSWVSSERWKNLQEQTRVASESLQNNLGPSIPINIKELSKLPNELALAELTKRFDTTSIPRHKLALAFALSKYGRVEVDYLVSRIEDIADADTANFFTALDRNREKAIVALKAVAAQCIDKSTWRTKAKLSLAALALGNADLAEDVCTIENRPDPEQRTLFIDTFPHWESDLGQVLSTVRGTESSSLRSAVCLGVGSIPSDVVSDASKESWRKVVSQWFVEKPDSVTHSATSWLMRQWKLPLPELPNASVILPERDWFVNSVGATMVRIRPHPSEITLVDPIEKYREQLAQMANPTEAELEAPAWLESRAVAYFHTGRTEEALQDLDLLRSVAEAEGQSTIIQYRTLALAKLGKAEEAINSLTEYLPTDDPASDKLYVEIQVAAWLGAVDIALQKLKRGESDFQGDKAGLYNIACAAAMSAQATTAQSNEVSSKFVDHALEIMDRLKVIGYKNLDQVKQDPDFAILHGDPRFISKLQNWIQIAEYWVANCEVTRGQFEKFVQDKKTAASEKPEQWEGINKNISSTAEHPAQNVSWYDAVLYCNWLTLSEGRSPVYKRSGTKEKGGYDAWEEIPWANGYRLLHEAEWEYACRAGTVTEFASGNDETLLVKYSQMYPATLTSKAGAKLPNGMGLYDMHGNVIEWCFDKYGSEDSGRAGRGGGWNDRAAVCRSAESYGYGPSNRFFLGFRLALSPSRNKETGLAEPAGVGTEGAKAERPPKLP